MSIRSPEKPYAQNVNKAGVALSKTCWVIKHLKCGHCELRRALSVKILIRFSRWNTKKRRQKKVINNYLYDHIF